MSSKLPYFLGFSHFLGIGPYRFNKLMSYFDDDVERAYRAKLNVLRQLIGSKIAENFDAFRQEFDLFETERELYQKSIIVLCRKSRRYPKQLLDLEDAPICIYVRGDLDKINLLSDSLIAIVGTRTPTSYGLSITNRFSKELVGMGFSIVSGMALGIDTAAHEGALEANGKTIAVLGCGVDLPHPPSNRHLYDRIIDGGGLVMSEFPPGMTVKPGLFIARNRIISGLSRGVLVVEGGKDSGALITANCALQQGKDIFAVPASITSSMSAAPNFLLKQGAKLVTSVDDILEEFNMKAVSLKQKIQVKLEPEEERLFNLLSKEPMSVDDITNSLKSPMSSILRLITELEMKKLIQKNIEGRYQIIL